MTTVTLSLAIIAIIIIIRRGPLIGLLVYCASLMWYPQYLTLKMGTLDFSLSRTVVLALLAIVIIRDKLHISFRWKLMDTLIILYVILKLISISQNEQVMIYIEREGGAFIDTVLIYFTIRLVIKTKEAMLYLFKGLVIMSIPIALIGVYQSITGYNVYAFTKQYNAFQVIDQAYYIRHGFYRADSSIGNYIAYGMYFASLVPISILLFDERHKKRSSCIIVIMVAGVLSSMSSGPYFAMAISLITLAVFPFRSYWKVIIITIIAAISFLDFYSNRSWYEALSRLAFNGQTAYYRIALIQEALHGGMNNNWLTGYGYVGIDTVYNSLGKLWYWEHQDLTNIYLQILVRYGLLGFIPFFMINIHYYQLLFKGFCKIKRYDSWLIWCLFSALFGWNIAMQTVGLLEQTTSIFYIYIAICACIPALMDLKTVSILR